jgi:hypothetical protein
VEETRRAAEVEHNAVRALHAVAAVVDLNDQQKDALHAAFVEKARTFEESDQPAALQTRFGYEFHDEPRVENALEIARTILTPEQTTLYEQQLEDEARHREQHTKSAMEIMTRVFKGAVGTSR